MLIGFFGFEKAISDSLSCGCVRAKVISAACAVRDELVEKLMFLPAAAFASLAYIFAHAKHVGAAMVMTTKCSKTEPVRKKWSFGEKHFSHALPLRAMAQTVSMSALLMRVRIGDWLIIR